MQCIFSLFGYIIRIVFILVLDEPNSPDDPSLGVAAIAGISVALVVAIGAIIAAVVVKRQRSKDSGTAGNNGIYLTV